MFMALYRAAAFCIVLGVMIALAALACAVATVAVLVAIVYGLASRKRTIRSALRALAINLAAAVRLIASLRPQERDGGDS